MLIKNSAIEMEDSYNESLMGMREKFNVLRGAPNKIPNKATLVPSEGSSFGY
jgi:hypothetical protein